MNDVFVLEGHDRLADLRDVLVEDLSFQDGEELWEVVHDALPVAFSDRVARALGVRSVNEDLSLVEADVEGADDRVDTHPQLELFSLIDLVTNVVLAFLDEQDFVNFIQLVVDCFLGQELSWLENFQNFNHEVLVLHIIPGVETVINPNVGAFLCLARIVLREVEELLEILDESLEQEIFVDVLLYLGRQLDK